jgi:hypothetical protein
MSVTRNIVSVLLLLLLLLLCMRRSSQVCTMSCQLLLQLLPRWYPGRCHELQQR